MSPGALRSSSKSFSGAWLAPLVTGVRHVDQRKHAGAQYICNGTDTLSDTPRPNGEADDGDGGDGGGILRLEDYAHPPDALRARPQRSRFPEETAGLGGVATKHGVPKILGEISTGA